MGKENWQIQEELHLGFFGGDREKIEKQLDEQFGKGKWRTAWRLKNGEVQDYESQFYRNFVGGYALALAHNMGEAKALAEQYSYAYDKDPISREEAFDPFAYYQRPGFVNQIHHAGFNIAMETALGIKFSGDLPLQIRSGKPGTDPKTWPEGWEWSPGRIATPRPEMIPPVEVSRRWHWQEGSIEHMYQAAKVIQVLKSD